ncbi:MAG: bifunctional pyr operon transcriptional regulator/uracil phosphoribosyltransferase PyrR [Clostridia bacterium]|nr:bifunctional pyr operon transcriptional regulator/uracil phosphoribosyltransferase PyrR [Clostridia bacterium]
MSANFRSKIMEEADVRRALARIAHEIIERNGHEQELFLLGVKRRGAPLAELIAQNIEKFSDLTVHRGTVDITCYRDDLSPETKEPQTLSEPEFSVEGKTVILVDDVIYTGRSARAALEAVLSWGRPARIQLAVLIDRGHRELPIRGDYVGKNVPTAKSELIKVHIPPFDETIDVELYGN